MGDSDHLLVQRSFYTPHTVKHLSDKCCKSDINMIHSEAHNLQYFCEYYKKYEHDAVPVRDSTYHTTRAGGTGDRESLTNSELDKLEMSIFKNMSQEFQTDNNSSHTSLESNIKLFKTTVQEIFDNFNASMQDFELYKKRFNDILAKNQKAAIADMEDFIKDMIQHITLSESTSNDSKRSTDTKKCNDIRTSNNSNISNNSKKSGSSKAGWVIDEVSINSSLDGNNRLSFTKSPEKIILNRESSKMNVGNLPSVFESYKNYDYATDSTVEETKMEQSKSDAQNDEILSIYVLSEAPCVQIKMADRNLISEINLKEPSLKPVECKYGASAENVKKLAAKEKELEKIVKQKQSNETGPDRDIPVKVSCAKRNIHVSEEIISNRESEKSFLSRLCSYICKRFRKL